MMILKNRSVSSLKNTIFSLPSRLFSSIKNQKYSWYLLPITCVITEYGKIISEDNNKFIIQTLTKNILVINVSKNSNYIRLFRDGDLVLEFIDSKIDDTCFSRIIRDQKFTFKNGKLIRTEILNNREWITISSEESENTSSSNNFTPFASIQKRNYSTFKKIKNRNTWENLNIQVNSIFSSINLEKWINKLWKDIENNFNKNNHLFILFKIKYTNGDFASIGNVQRLNLMDKNWYIHFISTLIKNKSEYYNETQIEFINISYGFKKGIVPNKEEDLEQIPLHIIKGIKIPLSMNPNYYGKILFEHDNLFILQNKLGWVSHITKFDHYNEIKIFKNEVLLLSFKDILIDNSNFIRTINNKKYHIRNNNIVLQTMDFKTRFISKIKKSTLLMNNFITLDIETFIDKNSNLVPYLISFYDGISHFSFYLSDYNNEEHMMITCFRSILHRKYHGYKIYVHNLARFDVIFLLKYLVQMGKIEPIIHNGKIISIKVKFGKYNVEFKDSYLMLLSSLLKLGKGFGINTVKSVFPFLFVNENNLNYIGNVPDLKYFGNKINQQEFIEYSANFKTWSLKRNAIKYCEIDCKSLYEIILKFNELIFKLFSINIHKYLTLPSLAFGIFRSNFMETENIPQIFGKIEKDIRKGYTGGSVDVFIPRGKNIKCYDVNSLYPFVMYSNKMPIGKPTYFEGDILNLNKDAFGFFYCKITAPDNILHPIIQTHVKIGNSTRTISPIGSWENMIFSEELKNAIKYGYKFEILWGYTFEESKIFTNYVDYLYHNLRMKYHKSNPLNYIAKILLNSLYGRFGMNDQFPKIEVISEDFINNFENKFLDQIIDKIKLGNKYIIIYNSSEVLDDPKTHNISVSIAAAITAYARIHMSQFKNNPDINLFYTDTDSIYTDSELPSYLINEKVLGKLKLEYICKEAIFLAPKVYCLKLEDNTIIYKAKGLKHEIELTFKDFEKLLIKNSKLEKIQPKWFRSLEKGTINIRNQIYTLSITENKRKLIYNDNKSFVSTKAYKINYEKSITKENN